MREVFVALPLLLAACAWTDPRASGGHCNAAAAQALVGQISTPKLPERARKLAQVAEVRQIRPGEMATMDYREDRLTLDVDASGRVTAARCG